MSDLNPVSCSAHPAATTGSCPPPAMLYAFSDLEYGLFFRPGDLAPSQAGCHRYRPERGDWTASLERLRPEVLVSGWTTPPLPLEWIEREHCPLRYVCHLTGSVRGLIPRVFLERGGLVTNWGGVAASGVAEHALLLALMALRNQRGWSGIIQKADEKSPPTYDLQTRTLYGQRVGIHGYGRVARELIKLLQPFNVEIRVYTAGLEPAIIEGDGHYACATLEELFSQSHIFFECEALNRENAGSASAAMLARLPDRAVFVNVGRGQLVDEEALLRESECGRIRVALDVVQNEPVNASLGFLRHRDSIISPHIAGPTADRYRSCAESAFQNLSRYLSGQRLKNLVTLEAYDRST
ncbi:MAG: hydroxyacid dehydrogenase [Verrucomicrobiota bacterium JB024]|nr:hydroxyacid dehydrogenase [Verrucomicrobiota bacterium JB024]